jgi:phosphoribosylglycinamide formyltransferase-1
MNLAVFASGRGSNLKAILEAIQSGFLPMNLVAVISNNSKAGALELARQYNIAAYHISQQQYLTEEEYTNYLLNILKNHSVDIIALAGYMKKIPPKIIRAYPKRIVNIHPALLPKFGGVGMYGISVHEAVIASGDKTSGVTVHFVDEEYDHGSIIRQRQVAVLQSDTPESLASKVLQIEHSLYSEVLRDIALGKIT